MTHSVEKHLEVSPAIYDVEIRRFVPGYDAMLEEVVGALAEHLPNEAASVLDLGAGTGALSAMIAARFPKVRLTLLDADLEMLARAEARLAAERARIELRRGSFSCKHVRVRHRRGARDDQRSRLLGARRSLALRTEHGHRGQKRTLASHVV
jgi:SAM-dependent methyltransferase